jgi:hypothetical protein
LNEFKKGSSEALSGKRLLITVGEYEQKTLPGTAPRRVEFFRRQKWWTTPDNLLKDSKAQRPAM